MIGNDSSDIKTNFSGSSMRACFFAIEEKQTYMLYLMWIFINSVTIVLSIFFLKKIFKDINKQMKLRVIQQLPNFYQKNMHLANRLLKPQHNSELNKDYKIYRLKCLTYADLIQDDLNNNFVKLNLKNSYSFNRANTIEKRPHIVYFKIDRKKYQSSLSINLSHPLSPKNKSKSRLVDLKKKFLQNIKIQFIVIGLFVTCLGPLFLVIAIDFNFKSFPNNIYRCLCLIAFTAPCVTPLCYFTLLIPSANKYCLFCFKIFRTGIFYFCFYLILYFYGFIQLDCFLDGISSRKKSELYSSIENYYNIIGKRLNENNFLRENV